MNDYYSYDSYYSEESSADKILNEAKEKLKTIINADIKAEIESIKNENITLHKELQEYRIKENELRNRELEIERREKQDINELYSEKWSETLKPLIDNFTAWRVGYKSVQKPKCDKCDENRKITYTSPHGDTMQKICECDKRYFKYFPDKTIIEEIRLTKDRDSYSNENFKIIPKYDSKDYDDMFSNLEFERYMDKFDLNFISEEGLSNYQLGQKVVWTNEKACQDCCDYLNEKGSLRF